MKPLTWQSPIPHLTELFTDLRAHDPIWLLTITEICNPRQGGVFDELDVVPFVVLLMLAGNETTTNLIRNAVHTLIDHPDRQTLNKHPNAPLPASYVF